MPINYTTISLPEELADQIREHSGHNMEERLRNWAEQYNQQPGQKWTQTELERLIRDISNDVVEEYANRR